VDFFYDGYRLVAEQQVANAGFSMNIFIDVQISVPSEIPFIFGSRINSGNPFFIFSGIGF